MWKWRRTPSVWRSTNCNYCRWVLKTVSPLFIYLFFLVLNVLFLTFGVLKYALAYASSWTFIQHINKCLSVDTANELDDLISGEESQSYWLVPFRFLFVLSVSLTSPYYQDFFFHQNWCTSLRLGIFVFARCCQSCVGSQSLFTYQSMRYIFCP